MSLRILAAVALLIPVLSFAQEPQPAMPAPAPPAVAPDPNTPPPPEPPAYAPPQQPVQPPSAAPAQPPPAPPQQGVPQPVYPPQGGAYPPPAYPPPPGYAPRPPRRPYQRDSWYIGFGLGTGNGSVSGQGDTFSFKELNQGALVSNQDPVNIALNFKVGATLTPKLLLGLDITAVRSQLDDSGDSAGVQVTNYDVVATWFPVERGFFARGGVGFSSLTFDADVAGLGSGSNTYRGANVLLGVGYAFWLGRSFNLTLNLDYSAQGYGSSNTDPETSSMWLAYLGFDWY